MNNLVSIITPSYKAKKFIDKTIESVLAQTYQNWEMIIVDDFSSDNSNEIIEKYLQKDNRIKLIKLNRNSGAAISRNRAIEEAQGQYIAFLDSDDLWKPQKLEKQIKFMQQKDCALSYTQYETINEQGEKINRTKKTPTKVSYSDLLKSDHIGCLTAIYDTKKIGKVYMPIMDRRQDYALWLKILKKIDFAYGLEERLASYRMLKDSLSSNKWKLVEYNFYLFRDEEKFSRLKSSYYVSWNITIKILQICQNKFQSFREYLNKKF